MAKGMKTVLEERGISTVCMKADTMRAILAEHADFKKNKCKLKHPVSIQEPA